MAEMHMITINEALKFQLESYYYERMFNNE